MTPVHLHRCAPEVNMARFYAVRVVPTLLGTWAVVREWGRIGAPGTVREDWFPSRAAAITAARALVTRKRRRGYTSQAA